MTLPPPNPPESAPTVTPSSIWDWTGTLETLSQWLSDNGVHPGEAVVLLPFAQMMAPARAAWGARFPDSFVPTFETTHNWAQRLSLSDKRADDLTLDAAHDSVVAAAILSAVNVRGLDRAWRATLAPQLVSAATSIASVAAAVQPSERSAWAQQKQVALAEGSGDGFQRWESLLGALAVSWAGGSQYISDVLWAPWVQKQTKALVLIPGLGVDPLAQALLAHWPLATCLPPLHIAAQPLDEGQSAEAAPIQPIRIFTAESAQDEAEIAATRVLGHLREGRVPVAIVAQDRLLTKRIHAHLQAVGVDWRDETGWRLSTTPIAAFVMSWLQACARDASSDALLDFVKLCPRWTEDEVMSFEAVVRRERLRRAAAVMAHADVPTLSGLADVLAAGAQPRTLGAWRRQVLSILFESAFLSAEDVATSDSLTDDAVPFFELLRLRQEIALDAASLDASGWTGALDAAVLDWDVAQAPDWQALSRTRFTAWLRATLEGASFKPGYIGRIEVVALPMAQLYGRPLGAVVLAGCDATHLPSYVAEQGIWTPQQREILGLDSPSASTQKAYDAWCVALRSAVVDLLWRQSDGEQAVQPAPWLSRLMQGAQESVADEAQITSAWFAKRAWEAGVDERETTACEANATAPAQGRLDQDLPATVSASAYQALRDCPYRFYALHALKLSDAAELAEAPGSREFGNWVHATLHRFHVQRLANGEAASSAAQDRLALDGHADASLSPWLRDDPDFLPYVAVWPSLRDGYLAWLSTHEATGLRVEATEDKRDRLLWLTPDAESSADAPAAALSVSLKGTIDRIDTMGNGSGSGSGVLRRVLMDYKTERLDKTKARVSKPLEDTQLAFYVALVNEEQAESAVAAQYLNLSGKALADGRPDGQATQAVSSPQAISSAHSLLEGIRTDWLRMGSGTPLLPLGDGAVCTHCAAKGLCRKPYWGDVAGDAS